jgi:hypothetical protein
MVGCEGYRWLVEMADISVSDSESEENFAGLGIDWEADLFDSPATEFITASVTVSASISVSPLDAFVGKKVKPASYSISSLFSSAKKWFGRRSDETVDEKKAIACQAAISYNQIMAANSGYWKPKTGSRAELPGLWSPCVIPKALAVNPGIFIDTMKAINLLYNKDLGYAEGTNELCNEYNYQEADGMVIFFLRTGSRAEFIHEYLPLPSAPPLERPFIVADGNNNGSGVLHSALVANYWKNTMDGLSHVNAPKRFSVFPLSSALIEDSVAASGGLVDFNNTVKDVLYQLGRARAYLSQQPEPPNFEAYMAKNGLSYSTVDTFATTIRSYYREIILPLMNLTDFSWSKLNDSSLIHWSNHVIVCLFFYNNDRGFDEDTDQNADIPYPKSTEELLQRVLSSEYRIASVE